MAIKTSATGPEARVADAKLTGDDFMELVRSKDVTARVAAAGREDAPMGALIAFAQDPKADVRIAVASNPGIGRTTTVAQALSRDKNADVARALVANPAVSRAAIAIVAESGPRSVRDLAQERLRS